MSCRRASYISSDRFRPRAIQSSSSRTRPPASARRSQDFQYQLVVQRVYEEGEAELLAEEEDEEPELGALAAEHDEKTFLLDEALHFRVENAKGPRRCCVGETSRATRATCTNSSCDSSIQPEQVKHFELVAKQCQYERKYRKPHTDSLERGPPPVRVRRAAHPTREPHPQPEPQAATESSDSMISSKNLANTAAKREKGPRRRQLPMETARPKAQPRPRSRPWLHQRRANPSCRDWRAPLFRLSLRRAFVLQDAKVTATVSEVGGTGSTGCRSPTASETGWAFRSLPTSTPSSTLNFSRSSSTSSPRTAQPTLG